MRLPNFMRKHQAPTPNTPESEQTNSAEQLPRDCAFNQKLGIAAETAITQRNRQEDHLTRAFLYGNEAFAKDDLPVTTADREQLYQLISSHKIGPTQEEQFLINIATPAHDPATHQLTRAGQALNSIDNLHGQRILAYMSNGNPRDLSTLTPDNITTFLSNYPTPVDFADAESQFLENIFRNNSDGKYREYLKDMETFKHTIYGKRQEYHEAFESLSGQAFQFQRERAQQDKANFTSGKAYVYLEDDSDLETS